MPSPFHRFFTAKLASRVGFTRRGGDMAEETYRYRAFISYRHVERDRKWARWLVEKLEAFRTPRALVRRGTPSRIGHLFRDDDEIPASSDLSHQIETALRESQYLIVVCSPLTPASRWVRREIEIFRQLGRGDRILALLVEGEPHDSFPPELLHVTEKRIGADGVETETLVDAEPIAADLRPRRDEKRNATQRRALLRIAAGLLGVSYDDLVRRERQRRMRRLRLQIVAAVLLCLFGIGVYAYAFVQTAYYREIGTRWGAPYGIGEIGEDDASHRAASYAVDSQFGRVIAVRRVNGWGTLTPLVGVIDGEPWDAGAAEWRISYASDFDEMFEARVIEVEVYDDYERRLRADKYTSLYDGTATVSFIGQTGGAQAFDAGAMILSRAHNIEETYEESTPASASGEEPDDVALSAGKSQIAQHLLIFDDDGLIAGRQFQTVWGAFARDDEGNYGRDYFYNADGQITGIRNLDKDGSVRPDYAGVAEVRKSYTAEGEIESVEWRDSKGRLALNADGYAVLRFRRDSYGNAIELLRLGTDGKLILGKKDGVARVAMAYSPEGTLRERRFFGIDGRPVLSKVSGAWRVFAEYRDNLYDQRYFGLDGKPVLEKSSGAARVVEAITQSGKVSEYRYFGTDGKPVLGRLYGAARIKIDYSETGDETRFCNFGANGKPVLDIPSGAACATNRYDERHHVLETRYFGVDGKPISSLVYKAARIEWEYDERGYCTGVAYYDAKGKRVAGPLGAARETYKYDDRGNITETAYFGASGAHALHKDERVARAVTVFDERGVPIEIRYYGVDDQPAANAKSGAARINESFDANGLGLERSYFGSTGFPVPSKRWAAARMTWAYDGRGNTTSIRYFGTDGKPVLGRDLGYMRIDCAYDERSRITAEAYFDGNGRPALNTLSGVARMTWRYDQRGNVVEAENFGRDGEPAADARSGIARIAYTYDRNGNETDERYFAPDGKPVVSKLTGYARIVWRYDLRGNKVGERYFGRNGKPLFAFDSRCTSKTFDYDDRGNLRMASCYGPDGRLSSGFANGAAQEISERNGIGEVTRVRRLDASGRDIRVHGN